MAQDEQGGWGRGGQESSGGVFRSRRLTQLRRDPAQLFEPLLQAGVGREELRDPGFGTEGGREVERVERLGRPQVLGRDPRDVPGDLRQRGRQSRGPAGEQGGGPVGGQLAVWDRARISRKLIAYTAAETAITAMKIATVFWSLRPRPPKSWE